MATRESERARITEHPEYVSVKRAAELLGVEIMTVYRYIRDGTLPAHDFAGFLTVLESDLSGVTVRGHFGKLSRWTRYTTAKRAEELEQAVLAGDLEDEDGRIVPELVSAWFAERGWTREELEENARSWSEGVK